MLSGYCLHPKAGADTCGKRIIRAHSVQRKGGLAAVAEDGHVISPKLGFEDIAKNKGEIVPRLHGVRDVSIMGYCDSHDDELFAPIEKAPIQLSKQSAFLLSFRAICYELFAKNAALEGVEIQRQQDKGAPFSVQWAIQQYLSDYREGIKRGLRDLNEWKGRYDAAYVSGNFDEFSFCAVMFSSDLPIVSCGAFHPEFDFAGNPLQAISRGDAMFEHVCFNLTVIDGKSVAVLGWTGDPDGPAEQFVNSFRALPKDAKANAAFHLACEHLENTYFRPSWWESQSDAAKEHLIQRFRSGMGVGGHERKADCLSRLEYVFASASVEQELS